MRQELFRVGSVAEWLGVSKKRVYAMIEEGKIEAIRFGPRQIRVSRRSVEAFIERLQQESCEFSRRC